MAWRNLHRTSCANPQLLVFATIQPIIFVLMFRYVFGGAIQRSLPPGVAVRQLPDARHLRADRGVRRRSRPASASPTTCSSGLHRAVPRRCRWRARRCWSGRTARRPRAQLLRGDPDVRRRASIVGFRDRTPTCGACSAAIGADPVLLVLAVVDLRDRRARGEGRRRPRRRRRSRSWRRWCSRRRRSCRRPACLVAAAVGEEPAGVVGGVGRTRAGPRGTDGALT